MLDLALAQVRPVYTLAIFRSVRAVSISYLNKLFAKAAALPRLVESVSLTGWSVTWLSGATAANQRGADCRSSKRFLWTLIPLPWVGGDCQQGEFGLTPPFCVRSE